MSELLHGGCLCGALRYEAQGALRAVTHCHCHMCRKAHGTAFSSYGAVRREDFRWVQGEDALAVYVSSPGVQRQFGGRCGSPLAGLSERSPDWVAQTLGSLDTVPAIKKQRHIHVASQAEWYVIHDAWPQWPEGA